MNSKVEEPVAHEEGPDLGDPVFIPPDLKDVPYSVEKQPGAVTWFDMNVERHFGPCAVLLGYLIAIWLGVFILWGICDVSIEILKLFFDVRSGS